MSDQPTVTKDTKMPNPAQGKEELTQAQRELLLRAGECSGTELIQRLLKLRFPRFTTYEFWAKRHGFRLGTVKAVFAGHRCEGPTARMVREALCRDLGLPEAVLFQDRDAA